MTRWSVCGLGVSCNEMSDTPMLFVVVCLEVFEFKAVILPCTGVGWREDVLRFNRCESVNNFVKKN